MDKKMKFAMLALPLAGSASYASERPNIVCIVSEDNTKDYMSLFCEGRGTKTPAIEALAKEGVMFNNCWSNGPVSSAARSTLISGCYGIRMASHFHRSEMMVEMADGMSMFPAYMRKAGYYTANNAKEDYNIIKGDDVWDDSSRKASWRNREEGQPFYYVYNIALTHEGQMIKSMDKLAAEVADYEPEYGVQLQPNFPDTETFRTCYKFYCKRIEDMDKTVGKVVADLKADGLLENTIIFYYGDNGGIMPNSKGYVTNMGLNVPMVVRVPEKYKDLIDVERDTRDDRFVSFVDLAPTIMKMAGVTPPEAMDGESFWEKKGDKSEILYGYAERMGEKYDMVRTLRKGKYKYVRNFQPFNFDALSNAYRMAMPTYIELIELHKEGKLNPVQEAFFEAKQPEMLFDIEADPYELNNLAGDPKMASTLRDLRGEMVDWQLENNDMGLFPEFYWIREAGAASTVYGAANSKRIARYLSIANLQLESYEKAEKKIANALSSSDPLDRYWALNVCSSMGKDATPMISKIREIAKSDAEATNRVRAAEFLAITRVDDPRAVMCEALYSVADPVEAALILNSMTLLSEGYQHETFEIDAKRLNPKIMGSAIVKSALNKHKLINE